MIICPPLDFHLIRNLLADRVSPREQEAAEQAEYKLEESDYDVDDDDDDDDDDDYDYDDDDESRDVHTRSLRL
jgi:hypothetical protein